MPNRNAAAAAVPLLIALAGAATLPRPEGGDIVRVRLARTASTPELQVDSLTEQQLAWLAEHNPFGLPKTGRPASWTLIVRQGYTLAHNNIDLIADWVSFRLTRDHVLGKEQRPGTSAFQPDPLLPPPRRAELADYKGWSGVYDRGHQCASADSKGRGNQVIRESFLLSNMTPQSSPLNQIRWRLLEERIQRLAQARGELWVITGPLFVDEDGDGIVEYFAIGARQVAVPTHYYKIVVVRKPAGDELEAFAFLFPNRKVEDAFERLLTSVDEIERLSGLDFLEELPDPQEDALESAIPAALWPEK
jgi:endonuclease G